MAQIAELDPSAHGGATGYADGATGRRFGQVHGYSSGPLRARTAGPAPQAEGAAGAELTGSTAPRATSRAAPAAQPSMSYRSMNSPASSTT